MKKNILIGVAILALIHTLVSVVVAIDKGMWEWYASFLLSVFVGYITSSRASELVDADNRAQKLEDAYTPYYAKRH